MRYRRVVSQNLRLNVKRSSFGAGHNALVIYRQLTFKRKKENLCYFYEQNTPRISLYFYVKQTQIIHLTVC